MKARERRRRARFSSDAILARLDPWLGPVERRDPSTYQQRSEVLTWMCPNPYCRQWTMNGAYLTGRCNFCFTPRPAVPIRALPQPGGSDVAKTSR